MLKRIVLAVLFAAASVLPAQASIVTGTKGIGDAGAVAINTPDIHTATLFTLSPLAFAGVGGTGDFMTFAGGLYFLGSTPFDTTSPGTFAVGDPALGVFTASSFVVDSVGLTSKTFIIYGTLTPGSDFFPTITDPSSASLSLVFSQIMIGGTVSVAGTLTTPDAPTVPEPATLVIWGALSAAGLVGYRRRQLA